MFVVIIYKCIVDPHGSAETNTVEKRTGEWSDQWQKSWLFSIEILHEISLFHVIADIMRYIIYTQLYNYTIYTYNIHITTCTCNI